MKIYDTLDLTADGVVLGNHGCWLPGRQIKLPFQWSGRLAKLTRFGEATWPREQLRHEYAILCALAERQMAPPVGDLVFFKEVVSLYPGAWYCDPLGAYGYEIADAAKLPPGRFDYEAMRALPIEGSPGAWNDVLKAGNTVNGYLVDARRSGQDILRWTGELPVLPDAPEDRDQLVARVHRECQFPAGERDLAYQDFWACGDLLLGQRRVVERAKLLGFFPRPGESVLDVGTQSGSFLQYAHVMTGGDARLVGVDVSPEYVACAKALARSCGQNICFRQMDARGEYLAFLNWVRAIFPGGRPAHLLLLSMEKHLAEEFLWRLVDDVGARYTYIETNAVAKDSGEGPAPSGAMKMIEEVRRRGGEHVGDSRDRNLRRLYRIERA